MQKNLDRALQPFMAKIVADLGLEVFRVAACTDKLSECLQRHPYLSRSSQNPEMEVEPVKRGCRVLRGRCQFVHGDDRISADQGSVTTDEFQRFFSAQKIKQIFLL